MRTLRGLAAVAALLATGCGADAPPATLTPNASAAAKAQLCSDMTAFASAGKAVNEASAQAQLLLTYAPKFNNDGHALNSAGDSADGGTAIAVATDLSAWAQLAQAGGDTTSAAANANADVAKLPACP